VEIISSSGGVRPVEDIFGSLQVTLLPLILVVGGFIFLFLAIFGGALDQLRKGRQIWAGTLGLLLIALGVLLVNVAPVSPCVEEVIQVSSPKAGAQVASPVTVSGFAGPAFEGTLVIEVHGEAGQLVGEGTATLQVDEIDARGPFETQVVFTVDTEQGGRVSVFTVSPRDGRIEHLSSVNVRLAPN
jgi:hypothetical protein